MEKQIWTTIREWKIFSCFTLLSLSSLSLSLFFFLSELTSKFIWQKNLSLTLMKQFIIFNYPIYSFSSSSVVKNLPAKQEMWVQSMGCKEDPWRRKWQPTPIFLPGKSHGWRSLAGYSSWGHKRVRHNLANEHACMHFNIDIQVYSY